MIAGWVVLSKNILDNISRLHWYKVHNLQGFLSEHAFMFSCQILKFTLCREHNRYMDSISIGKGDVASSYSFCDPCENVRSMIYSSILASTSSRIQERLWHAPIRNHGVLYFHLCVKLTVYAWFRLMDCPKFCQFLPLQRGRSYGNNGNSGVAWLSSPMQRGFHLILFKDWQSKKAKALTLEHRKDWLRDHLINQRISSPYKTYFESLLECFPSGKKW